MLVPKASYISVSSSKLNANIVLHTAAFTLSESCDFSAYLLDGKEYSKIYLSRSSDLKS